MKNHKNTTPTHKHTNREMSADTYALRRQVIACIYRLKEHHDLPRIDVRITDAPAHAAGLARMKDNIIWINAHTIQNHPAILFALVAHEVLHAVKGTPHSKCKLMAPIITEISDKLVLSLFAKHMEAV